MHGYAELAVLADLVEEGSVAVAVVDSVDPTLLARRLAEHLSADLVLRLHWPPRDGGCFSRLPAP